MDKPILAEWWGIKRADGAYMVDDVPSWSFDVLKAKYFPSKQAATDYFQHSFGPRAERVRIVALDAARRRAKRDFNRYLRVLTHR